MFDDGPKPKAPAPLPIPQKGGSYRRSPDGALIPVEGPGALPDNQSDQE
jgi:hypothetical protein